MMEIKAKKRIIGIIQHEKTKNQHEDFLSDFRGNLCGIWVYKKSVAFRNATDNETLILI